MHDADVREQLIEWAKGQCCPNCGRHGLTIDWRVFPGLRMRPVLICPNEACDFEASGT